MCSSRRSAPTTAPLRENHSSRRSASNPTTSPITASPQRPGRPIASSAPASSASGYKPKRDSWPRDRIPPPWDIEEANATCFIVKENNGQALAYVYFEQEPGRRTAANLLTRDEARRIAANIAKLPELVKRRPLKKGAADSPFHSNSFEPYSPI